MHKSMYIAIALCCQHLFAFSQSPGEIKILFIYGSKPAKGYRHIEHKWFGGLKGGHVGLEINKDSIINFSPINYHHFLGIGYSHIFPCNKKPNGHFTIKTEDETWKVFSSTYPVDSLKRRVIEIPITPLQMSVLKSIIKSYIAKTPYDYAALGMRCASATYEILNQIAIAEPGYGKKTWKKIFYPKDIREILMALASKNNWPDTLISKGCISRQWESD